MYKCCMWLLDSLGKLSHVSVCRCCMWYLTQHLSAVWVIHWVNCSMCLYVGVVCDTWHSIGLLFEWFTGWLVLCLYVSVVYDNSRHQQPAVLVVHRMTHSMCLYVGVVCDHQTHQQSAVWVIHRWLALCVCTQVLFVITQHFSSLLYEWFTADLLCVSVCRCCMWSPNESVVCCMSDSRLTCSVCLFVGVVCDHPTNQQSAVWVIQGWLALCVCT